ncbi:ABC transporter ATP-binding protein [Marinisporobacter balticus]|uniref:NitT/TauT family transport system ATP-binding protein n=1 Tax=Marinisporobacter balticus TaxID=2018667 RepID=A0A4R2KPB7_9FIRM|nr:ABC transporter ATP-binding protein [Marinisporobacter balticus]TCO72696.1 NitT/TauT family transport system ATP-binding protein [Marinisporobacter balticus]
MYKIDLENISFGYEEENLIIPVIKDVHLSIKEGEFVSIIGPSGCGKSTLLSLLAGLNFPSYGKILLDNKEVTGTGNERGVVFQHYSLFPWMSARKNIIFGLQQLDKNRNQKDIEKIADEYLDLVGLKEVSHKYPSQLSGGMQQRVAIARAFAMDSDILLMDEPFSAVDAKNRMALQELLLDLWNNGKKKKTVVFVTHDVDEAVLLSDRIIVMSANSKSIKEEINVDFSRPRNRSILSKNNTYTELRHMLVQLLFDDLINGTESEVWEAS